MLPTRFAHKSLLFFHSKSLFGEFLSAMLYLCDTRYTLLFTSALTPFQVFWRPVDLYGFIEEQKPRMKSLKYMTRGYTQMFQLQAQLMYSLIHYFEELWRQLSPNYLQKLRFVCKCNRKAHPIFCFYGK